MPQGPRVGTGQFSIKGSYKIRPTDPIMVGNERQLLMDDHVVDDCWNCRRTVHQPVKHPQNPLVAPTEPWEATGPAFLTVLHDQECGIYRLWATATAEREMGLVELARRAIYYESPDGIHWQAPKLGLVNWQGSMENNVLFGGDGRMYDSLGVIEMPPGKQERGRFAMVYHTDPVPDPVKGLIVTGGEQRIAYSDDGIHWRDQPENPIFRGQSDTHNNLAYNPERRVFMFYRRATIHANEIRRVAYSESDDLIEWTQPRTILRPDEVDASRFYAMPVGRYHGVYLGFLQIFYAEEHIRLPKSHQIDVQLAWSRDGVNWQRHPERPIFLDTGLPGSYDWGMVRIGPGVIEQEDEIRLYYAGAERLHFGMAGNWNACLATLRKDGFISVDSVGGRDGYMLTKPLECPGGTLHVNARTRGDGFIKVAVRRSDGEADGDWLPEWNYDKDVAFRGDSTSEVVNWQGQEDFEALRGKAIRLHFWLNEAELYSFRFQ